MRAEPCSLYAPQDFFPKMFPPTNILSQNVWERMEIFASKLDRNSSKHWKKNKTIQKTAKMDANATSTINWYCWILFSLCDSPPKILLENQTYPPLGTLLSRSNDFPKIPPKALGFSFLLQTTFESIEWFSENPTAFRWDFDESLVPSRLEDIIPGLVYKCLGSPHPTRPPRGLGRVVGGHRIDALAHSVLSGRCFFLVGWYFEHMFCKQKIRHGCRYIDLDIIYIYISNWEM